jgi:UDP-N-acetylmuramoyl-tripeptide--D-alanyl-D-alanine ligase
MKISCAEAVRVLHAQVIGELPPFIECTIDTRTIMPEQTYLALRGDRFDGHNFVAQAHEKGAAAVIVDNAAAVPPDMCGLVVADTREAYFHLAAAARGHFCGAVAAITGSAGKTTTKEFLAHILRKVTGGPVAATPANENNEIGVAKLLTTLHAESAAVIEMGARHFGDIAPLVSMARPQVAVLTNIGEAHIEIFGSLERLAETKWQIFSLGATPVLNFADQVSRERMADLEVEPILAGLAEDLDTLPLPQRYRCIILLETDSLRMKVPNKPDAVVALQATVPGAHNRRNLVAACAAAIALGFPLARVAQAAQSVVMPPGRFERRRMANGAVLIHDAYNASPSGTLASLAAFAQEQGGRQIVIFGSMAELGDHAVDEHRRVGSAIAEIAPSHVYFGGNYANELEAGARSADFPLERITHYDSNDELIAMLHKSLQSDDIVLVKASRMYRLDQVVDALTEPLAEKI